MTPTELIDRYVTAMRAGERATAHGFFADDIAFHIPGRSRFAGTHRGRDAAVAYIELADALLAD